MTGLQISKDLMAYFENRDGETLSIHSVFRESLNLIGHDGELITLLLPSKDIGPMSAIVPLNARELQQLQVDDVVEIHGSVLTFLKVNRVIDFSGTIIWNPDVKGRTKPLCSSKLVDRVEQLKTVIQTEGQMNGIAALISVLDFEETGLIKRTFSEPLNEYAEFIEDRIIDLLDGYFKHDRERILALIPRFVGFGQGLTPSTDDYLLGIMISMIYDAKSRKQELKSIYQFTDEIAQLVKGKTTKVSEEMIHHGAKGRVSERYRALVQAMFYDVKAPLERLCNDVLNTGSTSGTDFLFGVYCFNQLRLKWNREGGI